MAATIPMKPVAYGISIDVAALLLPPPEEELLLLLLLVPGTFFCWPLQVNLPRILLLDPAMA